MAMPIIEGFTPTSVENQLTHGSKAKMSLSFLTGGAAIAGLATKFGGYVHDGEVFVDRRLGNYDSPVFHKYSTFAPYVHTYTAEDENFRYGIKRRGFVFHKPGIQKWVPLSTRLNPAVPLEYQTVKSKDDRWLKVGGSITWRVIDEDDAVYKAVKAVNNNRATKIIEQLEPLVIETTGRQLVGAMYGKTLDEMTDLDAREMEVRERCEEPLSVLGVSLGTLLLKSTHPSDSDIEAQAKIRAAEITAYAIGDLATAIRESGQAQSDQPETRESIRMQGASRAAIGGVLAYTAQQLQEPAPGASIPFQIVPGSGYFDAAEGQL
jgi:hypothetical protein